MMTIYRATRVRTLYHPAEGEWLLVDGRHVERVGSGDPPAADRIVELPGTTIMPGFVDAHVHLTGTGLRLAGPDLGGAAIRVVYQLRTPAYLVNSTFQGGVCSNGGALSTLHASWTFSNVGQEECARFVAERRVPLGRLLTHRWRLAQADEAYKLFDTQTTGKGVFVF